MARRRTRYKNYTYGDQWCDIVRDRQGRYIREERLLEESGSRALTNNLIRQLVKSVVGRYRTQSAENGVYSESAISEIARQNALAELDSRLLEEFLISGCAIQRIVEERRWEGCGVWIDNVSLPRFFVNTFSDPRGHDIDLIGMLHDMTMPEIINRFAGGSKNRADKLRRLYTSSENEAAIEASTELGGLSDPDDFFRSSRPGRFRVIEAWTFDCRESKGNKAEMDFKWHCRYFAPDGSLLGEFDSPYKHGSHPFAIKFYPLTDGEVHSFVEDVIDQQRHINRLIVMIDKMLTTSAKGVLLFPLDQMADNMKWSDVTRVWAHSDGVIPISGRGTHLPQQVITNTSGSGAYELLHMQMKLFEDISGVSEALLGRIDSGVRGAEMLDSQVRNGTIALTDIFETFASFTDTRNRKAASV